MGYEELISRLAVQRTQVPSKNRAIIAICREPEIPPLQHIYLSTTYIIGADDIGAHAIASYSKSNDVSPTTTPTSKHFVLKLRTSIGCYAKNIYREGGLCWHGTVNAYYLSPLGIFTNHDLTRDRSLTSKIN